MAGKNEAKIKFTAETKDLTQQLRSAQSAMASFRAGLQLNNAELKNGGSQAEYLRNKHALLEAELQANTQKQEALNGKLEAAQRIYGENSAEAENWSRKLTQAKTEQQNLEAELSKCTQEIEQQAQAEQRAQTPLEQLTNTVEEQKRELDQLKTEYKNVALEQGTDSQAAQELKSQIDQLNSELNENEGKLREVDDALEEAGNDAQSSANGGWSVLNQVIADLASNAINAAINKLQEFGRETLQLGIDFNSSMSNVQAISGATDEQLAQLEESARSLGATTVFSASDVSDAFGYMAMAGWDTEQMLGGIEGVLNLAASSGADLATTSDIVTDALTAFGMEAGDASRLADVMAAASSNANTNVEMLGESFKYVAPVAGAMGYSAEDTAVALGLMANAGIKASQGGTALRTILTNLAKPTDDMAVALDGMGISLYDNEGNMYSLANVMGQLREGFGDLMIDNDEYTQGLERLQKELEDGTITEAQYQDMQSALAESCFGAEEAEKAKTAAMIAGKTGMSGLLAIINASESDYNKLTTAIDGSAGSAENMANVMNDNLGGDIKEMNSALEELKLQIFDGIDQPLRNLVQFITGSVVPAATQTLQFIKDHSVAFGVLAGVIGVITTAMALQSAAQAVQTAMNAAEVTSLGALIAAKLSSAAASWAALAPYIAIVAAIAAVIAIIVLCVTHWDQIKAKLIEVATTIKSTVISAWNTLKSNISSVMGTIRSTISGIWNSIKNTVGNTVENIRSKVSEVFEGVRSTATTIWDSIKEKIVEPIQDAYSKVTQKISDLKTKISEKISDIKSKVQETFDSIKEKMTKPIEDAKATISSVIETVKGFFPISIGNIFHNLKLPHFSVSPGSFPWGVGGEGSPPDFSVDWYRKAMEEPYMFSGATLFGAGEAGDEMLYGRQSLMDDIENAVSNAMTIDYDVLAERIASACAKMNISINMDHRELGRVIREKA